MNKFMKTLKKMRFIPLLLTPLLVVMMVVPATLVAAGQPTVELGTTSSFAVLAGETITNTGPTTITGDVGLHPGSAFTGQETVTLNGAVYLANAVALQAKNDLITAYNDAAGRTPVTTIPTELGGTTLTPGTYNSADGTFGITGTLTLDAQGDPDAVFVFKTASTLITASGSSVNLINGAQFCRIFWQVGSSATLGTNSNFMGHIFALTSITATTGATVQGQLLARNGSVTLDTNTISNGLCPTTAVAEEEVVEEKAAEEEVVEEKAAEKKVVEEKAAKKKVVEEKAAEEITVTGGEIPITSTPWYNILLAGAALTLIGAMGWWITRKIYE